MNLSPVFLFLLILTIVQTAAGQDPAPPATRAEQIQQERMRKAAALEPEKPDRIEHLFSRAMNDLPKLTRVGNVSLLGGADVGEGFAIGPVLTWKDNRDNFRLVLSAAGSTVGSYALGAGIVLPSAANRQLRFTLGALHANRPRLEFYGSGLASEKGARTGYRRETTEFNAGVSWRPNHRRWMAGILAGPMFVDVAPSTWRGITPTELRFTPAEAPAVDVETSFFKTTVYGDLDLRDLAGDPRDGSRVIASYSHHADINHGRYTFGIIGVAAEHYIPFLNKKRVIGLRGRIETALPASDQVVPFYLLPSLGGPNDLVGFRRNRFADNSLISAAAEYRWEVGTGVDMALFADAGKVFDRTQNIQLTSLERSAGIGIRVRSRDSVVFRLDTGFSREGFQIWMRFDTGLARTY